MTPSPYFNHSGQTHWNKTRLEKLIRILGKEWFDGKRILDVGCGHGNNGKYLVSLGARVTFTDGRSLHIDSLVRNGYDAHVMDQDAPWTLEGCYDLIVHWGVLYHLDQWRQDLQCAISRTPLLCLETEIWDSDDPFFEKKNTEIVHYDQALNRIGTVMSAGCLENYLEDLNTSFVRYDDADLNAGPMHYDWKCGTINGFKQGQRRFWMIRKISDHY